jgi:hypothetical protein
VISKLKKSTTVKRLLISCAALCWGLTLHAQTEPNHNAKDSLEEVHDARDSLLIDETENEEGKYKVLHAEPLYIDLIRDLGARKGEAEWNVGFGLFDNYTFDTYEALVEYEFAPMDRLGVEFEIPFLLYAPQGFSDTIKTPDSQMESIKTAAQWTFWVSKEYQTSMALGYINELEMAPFNQTQNGVFIGNVYNPFLIAAKRFGLRNHGLIYTGPQFHQDFVTGEWHNSYELNVNYHYMVTGGRSFLGLETNMNFYEDDYDIVLRPQMRLESSEQFLVGLVTGIPLSREEERLSFFVRLIYEP